MKKLSIFVAVIVLCGFATLTLVAPAKDDMNAVAERYAHLVLALGQHDPDYVDAFYGPAEWKTQAEKEKKSLDEIIKETSEPVASLGKYLPLGPDPAVLRSEKPSSDKVQPGTGPSRTGIATTENAGDEMEKLRAEYLV